MDKIHGINKAIKEYFELNEEVDEFRPKDLMPLLIKNGVFTSDNREGRPLRDVLRKLDDENQLHKIPSLQVERKPKNRFWYFVRSDLKKG